MIPKATIIREHVLVALREIDRNGVPSRRSSTKFSLVFDGRRYPPKYVVSLAHRIATGHELDSESFGGGEESNSFLRMLGFKITESIEERRTPARCPRPAKRESAAQLTVSSAHTERCRACKTTVQKLLEKLYGKVIANARIGIATKPDSLNDPLYGRALTAVYKALQDYRGFRDFVKSETLPGCDWFVSRPGFVVEFDESQHFTNCRAIALERYPLDMRLGYDRQVWREQCQKIDAKDNNPPYRDEQRAWYDTLRDFLPTFLHFKPTVRLLANEQRWCRLDPESDKDVENFRQIMSDKLSFWNLDIRSDPNPKAARIVIDGQWDGDVSLARSLLEDVADSWPRDKKVKCLITCGAFVTFDWPALLPNVGNNLFPNNDAFNALQASANEQIEVLLSGELAKKLALRTRYLTIGVDSYKDKISQTQTHIPESHIELVCFIDLKSGTRHLTGKSYPTPGQERGLVRNVDLASHMVETEYGRVLVLGCHDLSIFNPRSRSNRSGWRKEVADNWEKRMRRAAPVIVLQHPHTAVKTRTWLASWNELHKSLPSVKLSLGAGSYSMKDAGWEGRSPLGDVLKATRRGATLDFVAHIGGSGIIGVNKLN